MPISRNVVSNIHGPRYAAFPMVFVQNIDMENPYRGVFIEAGEVDASREWCDPLPSSIFLSIMGIDEHERDHFTAFKNVIIGGGDASSTPDLAARDAAFADCEAWFAAEFDRRERL